MHQRIDVHARDLGAPPPSTQETGVFAATTVVAQAVRLSSRHAWPVILGFLLAAIVCGNYFVRHFVISSDSQKLMSSALPWRQQETMLNLAFPERVNHIIAVIDAMTPEAADDAADALVRGLSSRSDVIRTVSRLDGGEFFERNGLLFLSLDDVRTVSAELISAQPFLGTLAADPTLRGIFHTLSQSLEAAGLGKAKLDDLSPAFAAIGDSLEAQAAGKNGAFSWRTLITGRAATPSELRHFVGIEPVLDFGDLQAGRKATAAIRETASRLGLVAEKGVRVRLTGSILLSDEEFATVADGAAFNAAVTLLLVGIVLWLALRKARIILAVFANLIVGLAVTAGVGLWLVEALNPMSVAFAVLFVGLGVDFGIQFSVRFRSERHACGDLGPALMATARGMAGPLLLATAAITTAFYSFLPTAYVGLSELGLIAGTGIIIAFVTTIALLPALLAVLGPPGEPKPIGYAALAPLDRFLDRRRHWIVGVTLGAAVVGLPLLGGLRFDVNPLNLRAQDSESVSTVLDLMKDPDLTPTSIEVLKANLAEALPVAERLRQLPEVGKVLTLQSFIPQDQDAKLALIEDASFFFQNTLNPERVDPAPTQAQTRAAIETLVPELKDAVRAVESPAAAQARRLAGLLAALARAPDAALEEAERALVVPLDTTLRQVRRLLTAQPVSLETLPERQATT